VSPPSDATASGPLTTTSSGDAPATTSIEGAPAGTDATNKPWEFGKRYAYGALAILLGVGTFNIIDRTVVNLLLVPIGRDLNLSDGQLGLFAGTAFGIFYALAQIPIARIADRRPRAQIISLALTFWSSMTLLQSSAVGFVTLALTRAGVAIGEAGSGPASMSMVADLFPTERRTRAFAILAAQAPFGVAIGALVAGWAREAFGWRGALMFVGIPGLLFAILVWRKLREPTRGYWQAGPTETPASLIETIRFLLGLAAFRHTLIGYTIAVTVAGAQSFDPVYLERVWEFAPKQVGSLIGAAGMLSVCGYYFGAWICDRMVVRDPSWALRLPAIFLVAHLAIAISYYLAPSRGVAITLALTAPFFPAILPIVLATVQTLSPATMRARATALVLTASTLVGIGCGAPLAGYLSDALTPTYGHQAIRYALVSIVVIGLSWTMLHFWLGSRTLKRDLAIRDARG
jgi:predicted MFS family arabinose efflux permease